MTSFKTFTIATVAALAFSMSGAYAQDAMSTDAMEGDAMGGDAMSSDAMGSDADVAMCLEQAGMITFEAPMQAAMDACNDMGGMMHDDAMGGDAMGSDAMDSDAMEGDAMEGDAN